MFSVCAIVDADCAHMCCEPPNEAGRVFLDWLRRRGRLISSAENAAELMRLNGWRRLFDDLARAGKLETLTPNCNMADLKRKTKSNDSHIVALAISGSAKVVFSNDNLLIRDLKDKEIVGDLNIFIYRTEKQRRHLETKSCRSKQRE